MIPVDLILPEGQVGKNNMIQISIQAASTVFEFGRMPEVFPRLGPVEDGKHQRVKINVVFDVKMTIHVAPYFMRLSKLVGDLTRRYLEKYGELMSSEEYLVKAKMEEENENNNNCVYIQIGGDYIMTNERAPKGGLSPYVEFGERVPDLELDLEKGEETQEVSQEGEIPQEQTQEIPQEQTQESPQEETEDMSLYS